MALLAYSDWSDEPTVSRRASGMVISLGRASRGEFVAEVLMAGVAAIWPVGYLIAPFALGVPPSINFNNAVAGVMMLFLLSQTVRRLAKLAQTHGEVTEVVVDADLVTARGPSAKPDSVATSQVVRFVVCRSSWPWLFQLDAVCVPSDVSERPSVTLVVAARRKVLAAAVDTLNACLGPTPRSTEAARRDRRRRRLRRRCSTATVLVASTVASVALMVASFSQTSAHWIRCDVLFASAMMAASVPIIYLTCTENGTGSERRFDAAEVGK